MKQFIVEALLGMLILGTGLGILIGSYIFISPLAPGLFIVTMIAIVISWGFGNALIKLWKARK